MKFFLIQATSLVLLCWIYFLQPSQVPSYMGRGDSNFLYDIYDFQSKFKDQNNVDQDNDGIGEFGLFRELLGCSNLRGKKIKIKDYEKYDDFRYTMRSTGYYDYGLYHFRVFLPCNQKILTDSNNKPLPASSNPLSINAQEKYWIAYGWPSPYGHTGPLGHQYKYCIVMNQSGKMLYALNLDNQGNPLYSGNKGPNYNAAMSPYLFTVRKELAASLDKNKISPGLVEEFSLNNCQLSKSSKVEKIKITNTIGLL